MPDAVLSDRSFEGELGAFLDRFNREVIPFIRRLRRATDASTGTLAEGEDGQVLTTALGAAVWALIRDSNIATDANIAVTKFAAGLDTYVLTTSGSTPTWAQIANANISAAAAIAVTKLAPGSNGQALITSAGAAGWGNDFGTKDNTTTGAWISNSATPQLRLGLIAGSGAGSASSVGFIRVSQSGTTSIISGRKNDDLTNIRLMSWGAISADVLEVGNSSAFASVQLQAGGGRLCQSGSGIMSWGINVIAPNVPNLSFDDAVSNPFITQTVASSTGQTLTILSQGVTGASGTITSGPLVLAAGAAASFLGTATNCVGAKTTVRGGDASGGTATNVGGDQLRRGGRGTGTGATDGNLADHADPASYQGMQRGAFLGNSAAAPSGNPAAGGFLYVVAGALTWRGSGGTVTTIAAA